MKQEKLQKILRIKQKITLILDYFHAFWKLILGVIGSLAAIGLIWALSENLLQSRRIDNTTIFLILLPLASFGVFYWMFRLGWEELKECREKGETLSSTTPQSLPAPPAKNNMYPNIHPIAKIIFVAFASWLWGSILWGSMWATALFFLVMIPFCASLFLLEIREFKKGGWRFFFTRRYWFLGKIESADK